MDEGINSFISSLSVEKGFSNNTLDAYKNDLSQFAEFICKQAAKEDKQQVTWVTVDRAIILDYLVTLREKSYAPATMARKVAAIKSFFNFLVAEGALKNNPTEGITGPKVGKALPKAISVEEG